MWCLLCCKYLSSGLIIRYVSRRFLVELTWLSLWQKFDFITEFLVALMFLWFNPSTPKSDLHVTSSYSITVE